MLQRQEQREIGIAVEGVLIDAGVDGTECVEPAQVEHDLTVQRDRAADEARVPALRNDRDARTRLSAPAGPRMRPGCSRSCEILA